MEKSVVKMQTFTLSVLHVLKTHGLNSDCFGEPHWAGTPEQQAALARMHEALCEFLPPLPEQENKP